jgi:hypothetical protein
MDRNRDLAVQIVNLQKRIDEQMDLDYARHGVTVIPEGKATSTAVTGDFYGIKADGTGTNVDIIIASMIVDGVTIATDIKLSGGDVFYGNITSVLMDAGGDANAILLHKKGHGPTFEVTAV